MTYNYLNLILKFTQKIKNAENFFLKIKSNIETKAIEDIRSKDKIIIGFMANYSSTWIGEELYYLFEQSQKFEPYVFVLANHNGQSKDFIAKEYEENVKFFREKNLRIVETYDVEAGKSKKRKDLGINPDICIWLSPWMNLFDRQFKIGNFSLRTLHAYIPYGFMIADNVNQNYIHHQYNHYTHNLFWKIFEESVMAVDTAQKYSYVKGTNAVFTGYPKMDMFYEKTEEDIWQSVVAKSGNKNAKRIIYAPHHTVDTDDIVHFSTFAYNYKAILELAKKYADQTVWIFKPHPHLKYKAIKYGIFKDEKEWDSYENEWRNLKNADVVSGGTYYGLFLHSDSMILDSVSFLAEYLYVHKPLLFLRGKRQRYNDFGKELIKIHYSVDGDAISQIEKYISDVVLNQKDVNKEVREQFFLSNLDYRNVLGKSAAENIYEEICHGIKVY